MRLRLLPARRLALLAAVCAAAACRELSFEPERPETVTFAPSLGVSLRDFTRLPSGVYVRDLAVGSGAAVESTSTIGFTYRGFLASGQAFDTTYATTPVAAPLATFVPGFRAGLLGVRQGTRRQLIIPPEQGYGNRTGPGNRIPAGSVLFFDLNLSSVTTPTTTTTPTSTRGAK